MHVRSILLTLLTLAVTALAATAQPPARFNYQGIARNGRSEPWANKELGLRISIRDKAGDGPVVYQETHTATTNEFGLYNIMIGAGAPVFGRLDTVAWGAGEKYVQIEMDADGGTTYADLGARQLLSVPYALHSANTTPPVLTLTGNTLSAGGNSVTLPGASGTVNFVSRFTSPNVLGNSQLLDDGTSVGIGVTPLSPAIKFQVIGLNVTAITGTSIGNNIAGVRGTTSGSGHGISGMVLSGGSGAAGYFDGGTSGRGILVPAGAVGINSNAPLHRLSVIGGTSTTGIDTNSAIYGMANTLAAARKGGVMGTYDPVLSSGIGVLGIGRDGLTHRMALDSFPFTALSTTNHIGLYGSATGLGIVGTTPSGLGILGAAKSGTGVSGLGMGANGEGVSGTGWIAGVRGTTGYTPPPGQPLPPNPAASYGLYGDAGTGVNRYGVYGTVTPANGAGTMSIGVAGIASSSTITTGTHYGVVGTASGGATNWAGYFVGNVNVAGSIAKASGTFKIDHPLDPENKYLYHSFVESPDMMNIYNGNITTDASGYATVTMPPYFDALNKDFRYQLTVIGTFAQAIVKEKMKGNSFLIQTSEPNVEVSWQVTGIRADKYAEAHRVQPEVEKTGSEKGKYLHPAEWGKPATSGIDQKLQKQQ